MEILGGGILFVLLMSSYCIYKMYSEHKRGVVEGKRDMLTHLYNKQKISDSTFNEEGRKLNIDND